MEKTYPLFFLEKICYFRQKKNHMHTLFIFSFTMQINFSLNYYSSDNYSKIYYNQHNKNIHKHRRKHMTDILTYEQLYTELENLNTNCCDAIYNNDIEEFNNIINDFIATGITKQERFSIAREAYRYATIPILVNDVWFGPKADEILNPHIFYASNGLTIKDIRERHDQEFYAFMVQNLSNMNTNAKPKQKRNIPSKQREEDFLLYLDKLAQLYDEPSDEAFSLPITDEKKYHSIFTNRVKELVDLRQQLYIIFDFQLRNAPKKILNIKNKTEKEKIEILTANLPNIYEKIDTSDTKSLLTYKDNPYNIAFTNYLEGKNINRANWKNYHLKMKLPSNIMLYLQIAFFLSLPSTVEIEKFLNLHGYSITKTDMLILPKVKLLKKYCVRCIDLCKWIDAGIDFNILNKLFGYEFQVTELRKPKKEEQKE